jgi:hypothetical protein
VNVPPSLIAFVSLVIPLEKVSGDSPPDAAIEEAAITLPFASTEKIGINVAEPYVPAVTPISAGIVFHRL